MVAVPFRRSDGLETLIGKVTIEITPVNDPPVLDPSYDHHWQAIASDQGTTIAEIITSGAVTDLDSPVTQAIALTAITPSAGTWSYSLDGQKWQTIISVSDNRALLLSDNHKLRLTPEPGYIGTPTLSFRAWDESSGEAGKLVDTSGNAYSVATDTIQVQILHLWDLAKGGNGHLYTLTDSPWNWQQAFTTALEMGGYLVTVNNASEQEFLNQTFMVGNGEKLPYWIGLNDATREGEFVWSNEETASYRNWNTGEPNNVNNEDYVATNWLHAKDSSTPIGLWNDLPLNGISVPGPYYGIVEVPVNINSLSKALIEGTPANDNLNGSDEGGIISGQAGKDRLVAKLGDDILLGGAGNDILIGDGGDDVLNGGDDSDRLLGKTGSDTFIVQPNQGLDTIADFVLGEDKIATDLDFEALDFNSNNWRTLIEYNGQTLAKLIKVSGLTEANFISTSGLDFTG